MQGAAKTLADARCASGALDLPMVLGPIAVVYTLAGVDNLQLSPTTLAEIFSGEIARWDDSAIKDENPGVNLPNTAILAVHRSDGSGTTDNFTSFLAGTAASAWTYDAGFTWPAPGGIGAAGNEGVAATVRATPGAIGYVELFFAEHAGLLTAKIKNAAGEYVRASADAASIGLSTAMLADGADGSAGANDD
nr:extracellular solute-binding protein [Micromonospora sp. DSM 115978]